MDRQIDGWMDGQTRVKTLPSRRTTYAGGNDGSNQESKVVSEKKRISNVLFDNVTKLQVD